MMTLEKSVSLVLFAMQNGEQGDLFVKKAPAANLKAILEVIEILCDTKAKSIEISGVRPGEKIHEALLNSEERTLAQEGKEYFQVPSIVLMEGDLASGLHQETGYCSNSTNMLSTEDLVQILSNDKDIQKII